MVTIRELGPFQRLITLRIGEADLEEAKERAARRLSRQVKIKGFRPGKAPRRVVEATVGAEALRSEAIEEAVPPALGSVLEEADLHPALAPRIQDLRDTEQGVEVDVQVTLWPALDAPPAYRDRRIVVGSLEVTEEEVERQIERLRDQFAELETSTRPAREGDFVAVDLSASRHGRPLEEASAKDLLYEVGSRSFIVGLDDELLGASAGDILQFNAVLPEGFGDLAGEEVTLKVLVREVRSKRLPEVSDQWMSEVSEFDTVEELREQLRTNLAEVKRSALRAEFRARVLDDLVDEVDLELPEALVGAEMERLLHRLLRDLEAREVTLEQFLEATGQSQDGFLEDLRSEAQRSLKTNAILEAVVEEEGLAVTPEDLDEVTAALARAADRDVGEYRRALREGNREMALASDILRQRAFEALVRAAMPIDEAGNPIDLQPAAPAADTEADAAETVDDSSGSEPAPAGEPTEVRER